MAMTTNDIIGYWIKDFLIVAVAPSIFVYLFSQYKEFKNRNEERLAVLNALHSELSTLDMLICSREEQYVEFVSNHSEQSFFPYISITLNYFTVFDNICARFGLINNQAAIENIIKCYAEVKGLFDDVKNLEYYAKQILNVTDQSQKDLFINNYSSNIESVVKVQLPKVKRLIKQSIQNINDEKHDIESKNTFFVFLFGDLFKKHN